MPIQVFEILSLAPFILFITQSLRLVNLFAYCQNYDWNIWTNASEE